MKRKIGLFIDYLNNSAFQQALFRGLETAIKEFDADLYVFNGGSAVEGSYKYVDQVNYAYELFNPDIFDGLLLSTTVGNYTSKEKYEEFLRPFSEKPIVILGPGPAAVRPVNHVRTKVDPVNRWIAVTVAGARWASAACDKKNQRDGNKRQRREQLFH